MSNWTRRRGLMLVLVFAGSAITQAAPDDPERPESPAGARVEIARRFYESAVQPLRPVASFRDDPDLISDPLAERVALWSRRWMEAERDSGTGRTIAAIEAHRGRMKTWEDEVLKPDYQHTLSGFRYKSLADIFKYHRLEAEFWLVKAKAER